MLGRETGAQTWTGTALSLQGNSLIVPSATPVPLKDNRGESEESTGDPKLH